MSAADGPDDDTRMRAAIASLGALRASLGDAAVDAAIEALRGGARSEAPPAVATPERRLRQVSVLFADIADSTAMLGRVGPEDAMDLVGLALQDFAAAIEARGGVVLRFTGDGLKAAFGTEALREDEAERAVRAGLDILARAARHAERVQRELGIAGFGVRVGIHTGPALLGGGVEAERTAMGHAVHLASRLEQSAPVGRLRVSAHTWAQVRGLFHGEAQPPLQVKGHDRPLATWLIVAEVGGPEPHVQRGVEGVETPMVGRDAELAALRELHGRTGAQRRLGVALVTGEAGVGKTRLREELLASLGLAEGDARLLQARAQPSSLLQPYGLLRSLLARWFDIRDDLAAGTARQRLVDGLAPFLGAGAAQQAPRIGQLIGLDFSEHDAVQAVDPAQLRRHAFQALIEALHARAGEAPLTIVLDDLHWADDASLDFVRLLCRPVALPLLVVLLARPVLQERGFALDADDAVEKVTVPLAALEAAHGEALVDALLRPLADAPASLRRLLLDRAGGNPFFLGALVGMLIDDGVIDARERPWRLHPERLARLDVPPTLLGVLQARLDALPAEELLSLQNASIVGPVFWEAALTAIDPASGRVLGALHRRSLVVPRPTSRFAGTAEAAFSHQLLHDTTYGTVLKPQRRHGHAVAARWLAERLTDRGGEFLAVTAEHYERAGESALALTYWDRAAVDAFWRYANAGALEFVDRALAQPALHDRQRRFELMSLKHRVLDRLGRSAQDAALCDEMAAHAELCDDDVMRAAVASARMIRADRDGRADEARALAEQALMLARRSGSDAAAPSAALALGELAWLAVQRRDFAATERHCREGLVLARRADDALGRDGREWGLALQLHALTVESLIRQERHADALEALEAGLSEVKARLGSVRLRFNLHLRQSQALRDLGRLDASLQVARRCHGIACDTGIPRLQVVAMTEIAETALLLGDLALAGSSLDAARAPAHALDQGYLVRALLELEGLLSQARGEPAKARLAYEESLRVLVPGSDPALRIRCQLATLDLADGRLDAAVARVDEVLAEAAQDAQPQHRAILPAGLLACFLVLRARGDARAASLLDDLGTRLAEQLAAVADDAQRRLVAALPWWRDTRRWLDAR